MKTTRPIEKKQSSAPIQIVVSAGMSTRGFAVQTQTERSATLGHNLQNIGLVVQPKLAIGEPNDKYEQEADRVVARVENSFLTKSIV